MKSVVGFNESFSTAEKLNWPCDICYVLFNRRIYFVIDESLELLGIKEHIRLRGWKKVESFLSNQGMKIENLIINMFV